MRSFVCGRITLEEVFLCGFGISKQAFKVLLTLKDEELTVKEISSKLNKHRTTVQKLLKELRDKDLVVRRQVNISKGGYKYLYSLKSKKEIKSKLKKLVKEWLQNAESLIDNF